MNFPQMVLYLSLYFLHQQFLLTEFCEQVIRYMLVVTAKGFQVIKVKRREIRRI